VDNLGFSFNKCHFCYTYLFAWDFNLFYVEFCVEGYFYSYGLKEFSSSPSLFATVCKGDPFCFVVLRVILYVLFLWGKGFSH
jgi:hypothetical protein